MINPNLLVQLLITVSNLAIIMRRQGIELEGKTEQQLKDILAELDREMAEWNNE